jgi:hypothetical protein
MKRKNPESGIRNPGKILPPLPPQGGEARRCLPDSAPLGGVGGEVSPGFRIPDSGF